MPNWVTNEVRFTFDMSHQKQKFLDFVKSDDNPFDFNKIIPMPEVFNRLCTNGTVANETCWIDHSKPNGVGEQLTDLELQRLKKEHGTVSGTVLITLRMMTMMIHKFGLALIPRGHHQLALLIFLNICLCQELSFAGFTAMKVMLGAVI